MRKGARFLVPVVEGTGLVPTVGGTTAILGAAVEAVGVGLGANVL